MAVASQRSINITFTGDLAFNQSTNAAQNAASPAVLDVKTFTGAGDNTVSVPGIAPTAVTIIPPAGNTQAIKLKGAGGDTGVLLHKTDPSSIGLDTGVASFILNVTGTVTGIRFIWT